ncbi:MAG TPA: ABC transporter substrate-binding protein [Phycisphaerales bacterium]|nr:ABC transporter substrate-binding protein [Phycisphaerales bacterium]
MTRPGGHAEGVRSGKDPVRVVSLLPGATESLCALGGGGMLVGRSHECDFPPGLGGLPELTAARTDQGGTAAEIDSQVRRAAEEAGAGGPQSLYTLDVERLVSLRPDVILTQDLCAVCSVDVGTVRKVAAGLTPRPEVVSLNPQTIEGVLDDLYTIGRAVGLEDRALEVVTRLRERMYAAGDYANPYAAGASVAVLEWTDPLFVGGHWTPQLVERAGGVHPLNPTVPVAGAGGALGPIGQTQRAAGKSVTVTAAQLVASRPEVLVIAPCGRTLVQARADAEELRSRAKREGWWDGLPAVKNGRVAVVDGNQFFNRPGPRLVDAFEWLVGVINGRPELTPPGFAWAWLE